MDDGVVGSGSWGLRMWRCGVTPLRWIAIFKKFSIILPTIITPIFFITMAKG
jgi:hypothetical protein